MDLAMRNRVDGFEMAIGRHFSAPGFCKERNIVNNLFDFNRRGRRRERRDKSSRLFIATGTFLRAVPNRGDKLAALLTRVQLPNGIRVIAPWAGRVTSTRRERFFTSGSLKINVTRGRYHAGTGRNRIYF